MPELSTFSPPTDAPQIDGLVFRRPSPQDASALASLYLRQRAQTSEAASALDAEREAQFRHLSNAAGDGSLENWIVAEIDGSMVGINQVIWWLEHDGTWVYLNLGLVDEAWRGRGLGTALIRWSEARTRQLAAQHDNGGQWEYAANANTDEPDATALVHAEGYYVVYTVLALKMTSFDRVPEAALPEGFELRPVLPEQHRAVWQSIRESYQKGRYSQTSTEADFQRYFESPSADPDLWLVAWSGDEIAGQVLCRIENGVGTVYEVSVRPAYRRHGLARALLAAGLRRLQARDAAAVEIMTVSEFPTRAKDLYASVGFELVKELPRYRKSRA